MSLFSITTALLASFASVCGSPTPAEIALARQFAPLWKFHDQESYWPSTIEFFLGGPVEVVDGSGNVIAASVNDQSLGEIPNSADLFIQTDIPANINGFLLGQNPSTQSPNVNTFIVPKDNGVIDLYYWIFCPYNLAKSVLNPLIGEVGDHVADWERMVVRTVNGTPTEVDYHAHSTSGSGVIPWAQVPKFDNNNRPVGYVANGSHGFWDSAGTFTYVNAVIFQLQDDTSDDGVAWDTQNSIVPLLYPDTYTGSLDWLNYQGAWGNQGTTNCWWYIFYNNCELVTGPTGPLRADVLNTTDAFVSTAATASFKQDSLNSLAGPLSQVLGTASSASTSSFKLHLDATVDTAVKANSFTKIAVKQTCVEAAKEEGAQDTVTTTVATANLPASTVTVTPAKCSTGFVTSYTIGLCTSDNTDTDCTWSPNARNLRAFHADASVRGKQNATAIIVNDLDNWRW